jgi:hypothetical protein
MDQREAELRERFDRCKQSLLGKVDAFTKDIAPMFIRNEWTYGWEEKSRIPSVIELNNLLSLLINRLDYESLISDKVILRTSGFLGFICQSCGRMEVSIFYDGNQFYGELKLVPVSTETDSF